MNSQLECFLFYFVCCFSIFNRALILHSINVVPRIGFFFDWVTLVFPILLLQIKGFSEHITTFLMILVVLSFIHYLFIVQSSDRSHFVDMTTEYKTKTSSFRIFKMFVLTTTATTILAADFSVFPTRFLKNVEYGHSLMDTGAAAFVFIQGLHDYESLLKNTSRTKLTANTRVFSFKWQALLLIGLIGFLRSAFIQISGYQQDIEEYGIHWNFFLTLFFLRLYAILIPKRWTISVGLILGMIYQLLLSFTTLEAWILNKLPRMGFIDQNREGIFSTLGYISLHSLSLIFASQSMPSSHCKGDINKMRGGIAFSVTTLLLQNFVEYFADTKASRRLANAPYVFAMVMAALFSTTMNMAQVMGMFVEIGLCSEHLIDAINRKSLFYFLLSNLITGLINMGLKVFLFGKPILEISLLLLYSLGISLTIYILNSKHKNKVM